MSRARLLAAVLPVLLAGPAARADAASPRDPVNGSADLRASVLGGLGLANGLLGACFELRHGHFAALLGVPVVPILAGAFGVRAFSGQGDGLVLSLHTLVSESRPDEGGTQAAFAATVGYRALFADHFILEVAAGPGGRWLSHDTRRERRGLNWGVITSTSDDINLRGFPDLELAIGWTF